MSLPKKALTSRDKFAATIDDGPALRALIAKLAAGWGVTVKEASARCMRMGANRYAALARYGKKVDAYAPQKAPKKAARAAKASTPKKAAKRASGAPKRAKAEGAPARHVNGQNAHLPSA